MKDLEIRLIGDVNFDGLIDGKDATQITRYSNLKSSIFNTGDEETKAYRLVVANVFNSDSVVDGKDATQITRYSNLKTSIFDTFK